ncbi:hypothetical protein CASFOL_031925 [Castilleja foliolosa]|uniref:Uncharacterized protein n=1 Tax=Castilleja foliolosa TaxID=1961234 RepID=A0ABD3C1C9_9LAMI
MAPPRPKRTRSNTANTRGSISQAPSDPIDISEDNGVPFPVYTMEEVARYKLIKNRRITPPKRFEMQEYEDLEAAGNEFAKDLMGYIRHMGCEELGATMGPAHTVLMHEFYTMFQETVHHEMSYRLRGQQFVLDKSKVKEVFGFDGEGKPIGQFIASQAEAFWVSLTNGNPGKPGNMLGTSIHDDSLFVCYKFLVTVILNKDNATVLSQNELKALYLLVNGETVPIMSLMIASINAIAKDKGTKWSTRLTFGGYISKLAQYHDISVGNAQAKIPVVHFEVKKRKIRNALFDIPRPPPPDDLNINEDMDGAEWEGDDDYQGGPDYGYGANEYMTGDEDMMERLTEMHIEAKGWYNEYREDKKEWAAWRVDYERNRREDELRREESERVARARHEETNAKLDAILAGQARWGHHGGSSSGGPGL